MKTVGSFGRFLRLGAMCGLAFVALGLAGHASAGCSPSFPSSPRSSAPEIGAPSLRGGMIQAGFWRDGHYSYDDDDDAVVVGLWKFRFLAKGNKDIPDNTPIDAGYVTWHSDGTELMNSGRLPKTGSFCMGAWKQTGIHTFKLNHYALSWDDSGSSLIGPTNIREQITVDRSGNSYSGVFTLTQYATDEKTILAVVKGTVSASRIKAD